MEDVSRAAGALLPPDFGEWPKPARRFLRALVNIPTWREHGFALCTDDQIAEWFDASDRSVRRWLKVATERGEVARVFVHRGSKLPDGKPADRGLSILVAGDAQRARRGGDVLDVAGRNGRAERPGLCSAMNKRTVRQGNPTLAVAYLRVSTDEQALGLEAQRAAIESWATARGVTIAVWCTDEGISGGAPLEARPELAQALVLLRELRAGVLVVAKRDRLARDVVVAAMVEKLAANAGAAVLSAAGEGSDATDDPSSQLLRWMVDAFAEYERAIKALAAKRARGKVLGGTAPRGFRLSDDGRRLVPDEREQQMLALVRELHTQGQGVRAIARALDAAGFRTRTGHKYHHSAVVQMLRAMDRARAAA